MSFAVVMAAGWLGCPDLARPTPELSVLILAVCLVLPMAAYMPVRGHPRRHNLEMTGGTIGPGLLVAGRLWSGIVPASGLEN